MKHNRLICIMLAVVLLLTTVVSVRADYENTYQNTGDQRADLIGVALTQVGYREGPNNYTKYGVWYGAPNTAWCGMFVSWCANQAGIPTSVLKKNGFASASGFGLSAFYVSERIPRAGDLFFKTNGSHTGIVYYVEGDYFYTIEGNTDEYSYDGVGVFIRKRSLYGSYYYASPKYQSDSGHNYVRGVESAHPHKVYYKCSDCASMYYTGTNGTYDGCVQCLQAACSHSYGSWEQYDSDSHNAVCSLCGKQTLFDHDWGSDRILTEATCKAPGSKWQKCRKCGATRVADIPVSDDHQYGEWEYVDQERHIRICQTCEREDTGSHSGEELYIGAYEHWYQCEDCGGRAQISAHDHNDDCEAACTVCGYKTPNGHSFGTTLSWDDEGHYYACASCDVVQQRESHSFSTECDESCDICGYLRTTEHTYGQQWQSNENGHWYSCEVCGQVQELRPHVMARTRQTSAGQTCGICGYRQVPTHVHQFAAVSLAGNVHDISCACGAGGEQGGHIWDLNTQQCKLCAASVPERPLGMSPWLLLLPAVALAAAAAATGIGVLNRKKRLQMQQDVTE